MSNNIIDIIERFQTRHALQEECEVKKFDASTNSAAAAGVPDKNGKAKNNIFEMEEVRVWTVAVPGNTEWSPPHDGRDRMVVTLGRIRQLPRDSDSAFPARWACIPSNSDFKVPNENNHTRNFLIVEFIDGNDQEKISQTEKIERKEN